MCKGPPCLLGWRCTMHWKLSLFLLESSPWLSHCPGLTGKATKASVQGFGWGSPWNLGKKISDRNERKGVWWKFLQSKAVSGSVVHPGCPQPVLISYWELVTARFIQLAPRKLKGCFSSEYFIPVTKWWHWFPPLGTTCESSTEQGNNELKCSH